MRKLETRDIFSFCRLIKKLGIKEQVKTIAQEANSAGEVWDRGFDLIWGLFDVATDEAGESVFYEFLAGPFEITPEEVRKLDFDTLFSNLRQLAAENNLTTFFKNAAKLMK